jgi:hypothetical protein
MSHSGDALRIDDIWSLLLPPRLASEETWNRLQEPIHSTPREQRYLALLAALDVGWYIEEPVYLRSRWGADDPPMYHFILRCNAQETPRLISVPQGPEVERFLLDHHLQIERH